VTKIMTSMMVLALSALFSVAHANTNDAKIAERIAPVGSVCIEGTECAAAGKVAAVASGPRSGSDVYGTYCVACHGTGAMGAPKLGDSAVWKSRLAKGFDTTLSNAINGLNMMPPKGTCSDCSDAEISNAIKHMSK
jgi:cytochrome c5